MPLVVPAPIYRRFAVAAVLCTMTLGASFGAYNLLWIHWALGPLPPGHNAFHASFQVTGFVLLFLVGFAYELAPRFLGTRLAFPRLAHATFFLTLGGLLLRGYGQFGRLLPATAPALAAGALLQLLAIVGFAATLAGTLAGSRRRLEPFQIGMAAGLVGWLAAGVMLMAGGLAAWRAGDADAAVAWNEPFYLAALVAGTLPFIQAVTLRAGSSFLGTREPRVRPAVVAIVVGQLGAGLAVAGRVLPGGHRWSAPLVAVGLLVSAAGVALFLAATGVLGRPVRRGPMAASATTRGARAAFVGAAAYAVLAALYGAMELAGRPPPSALYDGARHALGLGCITMLIFSMASRMIPAFERCTARRPSWTAAGLALVAAGFVGRELQVAAFLLPWPALLRVSGLSGIVAAAGVCLCGAAVLSTIRHGARRREGLLNIRPISPRPAYAEARSGASASGSPGSGSCAPVARWSRATRT
jgi:hypothetical protein